MFNEVNMMKALSWLHDLYQPDDYYDEEYCDLSIEEFPPRDLCGALRQKATMLYEYKVDSDVGTGFTYRGKEPMPMRGIPIVGHVTETVEDVDGATIRYGTELWLMEDMSSAAIETFLETLTTENRVIFMRRYWFADTYAQIADRAGISEKNVSVRLARTRKQLRNYLLQEGVLV